MKDEQAREDIRIIKAMLDRTRSATSESGTLFIAWGVLITLALIATYVLALLKTYRWEWMVWVGITVIGWVYSAIYGYRKDRRTEVKTYIQTAARHLYIGFGACGLLVGIILPRLDAYSHEAIVILIAVITGLLFFVMGGLFEWPLFKWCGLVWWVGAVGLTLVKGQNRILLYTLLFIAAYLVPAIILQAKYKQEKSAP